MSALNPSANRAGSSAATPGIKKIPCRCIWASCASDAGRYTSSPHRPAFNSADQAEESIGSPARLHAPKRGSSKSKECARTASPTMCSEEDMPMSASTNSCEASRDQLRAISRRMAEPSLSKRQKAGSAPNHCQANPVVL
jgi:hypothetical protein